jgi:hypothetical protein
MKDGMVRKRQHGMRQRVREGKIAREWQNIVCVVGFPFVATKSSFCSVCRYKFFLAPFVDTKSPGGVRVTPRNSTLFFIARAQHNPTFRAFDILDNLPSRVNMAENNNIIIPKIDALINQAVDLFDAGQNAECEAATRAALKHNVSIWQEIYCVALLEDCVEDWYDAEVSSRLYAHTD